MNFDHCIFEAAQRALDMNDVPDDLLPLVIVSEASYLGGLESDGLGAAPWH